MWKKSTLATTLVAALALAACGGGHGNDPAETPDAVPEAPAPEATVPEEPGPDAPAAAAPLGGLYFGTTSSKLSFHALVLNDGEFWMPYYDTPVSQIHGFLHGKGALSPDEYDISLVKDFAVHPPEPLQLTATYVPGASFDGTTSGGIVTFTSTPVPVENYKYDQKASISDIVGAWWLLDDYKTEYTFAVAGDGSIKGDSDGCEFSGAVIPRDSNENVFNLSVTFGPAPCQWPNQSITGVALSYMEDGGVDQQLIVMGFDAAQGFGVALIGGRAG